MDPDFGPSLWFLAQILWTEHQDVSAGGLIDRLLAGTDVPEDIRSAAEELMREIETR